MAGREAGGPETYEHCLVQSLAEIDRENDYHVFCLDRAAADSFLVKQDNFTYHVLRPRSRWVSVPFSLPVGLMRNRIDLLHATFVPPPFSPSRLVFTMHCFSTFAHPEFYPPDILWRLNKGIVRGLKSSGLNLCVSENVRDLTAEKFKLPAERQVVVYNGVGANFRPVALDHARKVLREKYNLRDQFALFVGQIKARKNVNRILEAFGQFHREVDPNVKLVFAGRRSWTSEDFDETVARLGLSDSVVEIGHVGHHDLPVFYSAAEMFLFPSLWEGFGIPVIESMACGTPVVTSNISSLPEVAGDAAVLVDPHRAEDIAAGMHRIFTDHTFRQNLIARGLERAKQFTWRRTAEQTLEAYRRLEG